MSSFTLNSAITHDASISFCLQDKKRIIYRLWNWIICLTMSLSLSHHLYKLKPRLIPQKIIQTLVLLYIYLKHAECFYILWVDYRFINQSIQCILKNAHTQTHIHVSKIESQTLLQVKLVLYCKPLLKFIRNSLGF